MMDDTGFAQALLGLDGFRVLDVCETPQELVITIESTLDRVGCADCGVRAQSQDRVTVDVRDVPCFGRLAHPAEIRRANKLLGLLRAGDPAGHVATT